MADAVNHPEHYGGDVPYEVIKVLEAWALGFRLGNAVKYIARAGKKGDALEDLEKARWYLEREIRSRRGELPWEEPDAPEENWRRIMREKSDRALAGEPFHGENQKAAS